MRASGALSFLILSLSLFFAIPSGLAQQTPAGKPKIAVFNIVVAREEMERMLREQEIKLSGITSTEDWTIQGKILLYPFALNVLLNSETWLDFG